VTDHSQLFLSRERENAPDGWVYWIGGDTGPIKIGWSKDPEKRLKQFQPGSPIELKVIHRVAGTYNDERRLHNELSNERLHGEWFERGAALMAAGVEWDDDMRLESDVGIGFADVDTALLRLYARASLQLVIAEAIRQHEPDHVRQMKWDLELAEVEKQTSRKRAWANVLEHLEIINRLAGESDDLKREVQALRKQNNQLASIGKLALEFADKS
jgi:hypothetical protein